MNALEKIPTKDDWGDISDPDIYYAYENFYGKNNEELLSEFEKNVTERCINLSAMPIKPFTYYIFGLKQFIEQDDFGEFSRSGAINGFIDAIDRRSQTNPCEVRQIYPNLKSLLDNIATNQASYEMDEDIYGSFKELVSDINARIDQESESMGSE